MNETVNSQGSKPNHQKKMTLVTFDEEEIQLEQQPNASHEEDEIEIEQDPKNQLMITFSNVSEGEKSKIERRNKVQQYINHRRSLGLGQQNKRNGYQDQEELEGALIDELGFIENVERFNSEIQLFIIAFNKNPDNAVADYIKKTIIKDDSAESIAEYLIKVEGLDKELLGEYFGKNNPKNLQILHSFCSLLKFNHVQFDKAIRQLLARFRLPGQSQQIERIIWQFSLAYFEANSDQHKNADELFPLAYAIIMLATDAHNPKQEKKMSVEQFIKNTQNACPSISSQYLTGIYDRITKEKFETEVNYIETLYARLRGVASNDFQSVLKLTKQLMKGDVFLKACYGAKKFVQRKIYLSEDQKRIEWVDDPQKSESQQPRFININDITDLTLGLGSDVMKKNNVPQQFDSLCFTITTYYRTLDLKAKTNKQRAKWVNYIRAILIRRREVRIENLELQLKINMSSDQIQEIWNTEIFPHWDDHWDYHKKKPKVKNVIVRKFEAICGCFSKQNKNGRERNQFESTGNTGKLKIKSSILQTLWGLGLPQNSRKILWPLVIGNNLALTSTILQEIKKRVRKDPELRKFTSFNNQVMEQAQICRQFRPDIPPVRDLLLVSQTFLKVFPKSQAMNGLNSLLNLLHAEHFLAFYRADKNEIDSRVKLFEYLLEINANKVKDHFKGLKLQIKMFLVSWFLSVFVDCFNQNQQFLLRIWDNFLLEGEIYLFKVGITIVKYYEVELKMCTFHEGLKLLRFPKNTSPTLFFKILEQEIDVKQEYYCEYVEKRKNAVIKTKVQAIPLE